MTVIQVYDACNLRLFFACVGACVGACVRACVRVWIRSTSSLGITATNRSGLESAHTSNWMCMNARLWEWSLHMYLSKNACKAAIFTNWERCHIGCSQSTRVCKYYPFVLL